MGENYEGEFGDDPEDDEGEDWGEETESKEW